MKKFSKILSLIFTALILMSAVSFSAFCKGEEQTKSGTCGDNLTWSIDDNGVLTISGKGKMAENPWSLYENDIKSVIINQGITSIDHFAFDGCKNLESIIIPNSVIYIGNSAFDNTAYINNPDNYDSDGVLYLTATDGTTKYLIQAQCYSHLKTQKIVSFTATDYVIKDNTKVICNFAFNWCSNLESITIPNSVTCIGDNAFYNTAYYNNPDNWEDGVLYLTANDGVTKYLIATNDSFTVTDYSVKEGTKVIANEIFKDKKSLQSVTLPNSLVYIGKNFLNENNFYDCENLKEIIVDSENQNYLSENGILFSKDKTELVCYPQGKKYSIYYNIPKSVTSFDYSRISAKNFFIRFHGSKDECSSLGGSDYISLVIYNTGLFFPMASLSEHVSDTDSIPGFIMNLHLLFLSIFLYYFLNIFYIFSVCAYCIKIVIVVIFICIILSRKKKTSKIKDNDILPESNDNNKNNNENDSIKTNNQV